ncbi:outer membrane beta-barrel protein [Zhongshania sp.]|uniref:outer membrane beta-barrel protein n=1 Tax=Zhongshania sp. TaxID=1971902 RepID=UPI0035683DBE
MKISEIYSAVMLATLCSIANAEIKLENGDSFLSLLTIGARHDDNISQDPDSQPRDSSAITVVQPAFLFKAESSKVRLDGAYNLTHEAYEYDSKDDHTDHTLLLDSQFTFNSRNKATLSFDYTKEQGIRTSINRSTPNEEVGDRSRFIDLFSKYQLGADSGRAQFEASLGASELRYSNNLNTLSQNRLKERDMISRGGTFYVRVAPKTRLLLEVLRTDFDYKAAESQLNNDSTKYYAGLIWELTAKTTGHIRYGQENKIFDNSGIADISEPAWDINITWQPRSYSRLNIATGKGAAEGSARSDVVNTTNTSISWVHDWSYRLESTLSFSLINEEYEGKTFNGREDDTSTALAALTYTLNRSLEINASYSRKSRESNAAIEEFDSNIVELSLTFAI